MYYLNDVTKYKYKNNENVIIKWAVFKAKSDIYDGAVNQFIGFCIRLF